LVSELSPQVPPISITPVDRSGSPTHTFIPGQNGRVYFSINDPSDDSRVTVHVFDSNASRDALTNPVATWVVNVSSGTYLSVTYGLEYTLPTTLVYGGNWNVTASGALGGNASTGFTVQTYGLVLNSTPTVLAGYGGSVSFLVAAVPTGGPYLLTSSVKLTAVYDDGATNAYESLPLTPSAFGPGVSQGSASFVLPTNASNAGEILFSAWANVSSNGNFSAVSSGSTNIANFAYTNVATDCSCLGQTVLPNTTVTVVATAWMLSQAGFQYAPGVAVSFSFMTGPTVVPNTAIPGSPPTTVTTGTNGVASILFVASPAVFSTSAPSQINISAIAVPSINGSAPSYYNTTVSFNVAANGTSGATIVASFNHPSYTGGEAGSISWQVLTIGGGASSGWSGFEYALVTAPPSTTVVTTVSMGLLSGASGTINFTAPGNYSGELELEFVAHNLTLGAVNYFYTVVNPAEIYLSASEAVYNPGDTVRFTVQTQGSAFAGATLYETASVSTGAVLSSGLVTGGAFSITIPSGVAPPAVMVRVTAQSPTLGAFASSSYTIYEAAGMTLSVGVSTISNYADGSFQPGQTLTITWTKSTYGPGQAASAYWAELWNTNGWFGAAAPLSEVLTTATSGSFQYTVPSGSAAGTQTLYVVLASESSCNNYCFGVGQVSYGINPSPSTLNLELGAGSGITVGWLILLIVIVVVAVLLLLGMRRSRTPKYPASTYSATTGPMSPPAPAPSAPAPQEWKESSASADPPPHPVESDDPPPLPAAPSSPQ
jgi:hypothetical protein